MINPLVLGVTGMPSSGKGVFSEIAKEYGFKEIIMGDVIREECKLKGLPVTRESSNIVMMELRKERGENAVAMITLEWIQDAIENEHSRILVDGIRSLSELETFKIDFPEFNLIAIHSDQKTRIERSLNRKRMDDAYTIEAFNERDKIELSLGIGNVIATADTLISSTGDLEETKLRITEFFVDYLHSNELEIELYPNEK